MRIAEKKELDALCGLFENAHHASLDYARMALERFAGVEHLLVEDGPNGPEAFVCAVPVTLGPRNGVYFYGLSAPQGREAEILHKAEEWVHEDGVTFAVARPRTAEQWALYTENSYQKAFGARRLSRAIRRNLWAQADFDAVTVRTLEQLRRQYAPDSVCLPSHALVEVMTDLYSRGLTIVSSEEGYGMYFQKGETLHFIELFAIGDRPAEKLMEAAREKVGAERAELLLGTEQTLFLGEGSREDYGCIRFFGRPFDVTESYMRLMLDAAEE